MEIRKKQSTQTIDWDKINIEYREPTVRDAVNAERISGSSSGTEYSLALISEICTFDSEKKVYEDLQGMPTFFFNELFSTISGISKEELAKLLS